MNSNYKLNTSPDIIIYFFDDIYQITELYNGRLIIIAGDKLIYNTAIKGTVHDIIPPGQDPYTEFRPNEPIDAFLATASVNARMVPSAISCGIMNKIIIELTTQCKDILGIKWNNLTNVNNL